MNKLISLIIAFFAIIVFSLIAQFFDIGYQYYAPYLLWIIALCLFNLFLDSQHYNVFLKERT